MQVLASADVHGRQSVYEWLIKVAREHQVEALVLAGDLLGCRDGFDTPEDSQRHEARTLVELLAGAGVPVLYIMGNDDLIELDSGSDRVQSIHGRQIEFGRFNFVGYQYSLPFMGGTFEKPDADIQADLARLPASFDATTVFVSHSPVWYSRSWVCGRANREPFSRRFPSGESVSGAYSRPQPRRVRSKR